MPKLRNRILSVALSIVVVLAAAFYLQGTKLDSQTPPELEANSELTGALTTGSGAAYYYDSNSPAFTGDANNTVSANAGSVTYLYSNQNQTLRDFLARIDGRNSTMMVDDVEVAGQFRFVNFGQASGTGKYKVYPLEYFTTNYNVSTYCCDGLSLDSQIPRNQVLIVYNSGDYDYKNNPTSAAMGSGEVDLGYEGWHLVYLGSNNQVSTPNSLGVLSAYKLNSDGSSTEVFANSGSDNFSVSANAVYWVKVGNVSASELPAVPDEGSQVADDDRSSDDRGSSSSNEPRTTISQTDLSISNLDTNCLFGLVGSGNSVGSLSSACNQLSANVDSDNPEVVNALLASLRTDQEGRANQAQDGEVVLGEDGQPIANLPEFAAAERIFANTVNVLHFDNNVTYEACEQSQAIEYLDFRLALINNYNQALSLNSIDISLTEENRQSIVSASLEGFTYNSETGILTANNPISMQSVTNDDSSYLFDLRIGVQNTDVSTFEFTFTPTFGITQAGEQDADFVASMVYGNGSSIRVEEFHTNCSGPEIPRPTGKLIISHLMGDQTDQCGDLPEVGSSYVGSDLTLTNTYLENVRVSEVTLRFDQLAGLDVDRSTFNDVTGSLGEGNRLVFVFNEPLILESDTSSSFSLKLYNLEGESIDLNVIDLDVIGRTADENFVENLYSSDVNEANSVNYLINYTSECTPEAVSNVTYTSMFVGTTTSRVCSESQHVTLSNSILVVETDENNSHLINTLSFDITKSEDSELGGLTYTLVDGDVSYVGELAAEGAVVNFNFPNPIVVEESRVFELLLDSNIEGAEGTLTLALQDIDNAEVAVELNYEFIVDETLCPIVAPYYEVSNVSSLSRNYCQNIEEVSGSSFEISVDILNREEEFTSGSVTLAFAELLPPDITFDYGDIAEDRSSVTFADEQFEAGFNRLSFTANFTADLDNNFYLKVNSVNYVINGNTGSYLVSSNDGVFAIDSKFDCSDDSSPFMHVVSSSDELAYCPDDVPEVPEATEVSFVVINPTDEELQISSIEIFATDAAPDLQTLYDAVEGSPIVKFEVEDLIPGINYNEDSITIIFDENDTAIAANSSRQFTVMVSSDVAYDLSFNRIEISNFVRRYLNDENTLSVEADTIIDKAIDFSFIQNLSADLCPDPGTLTLAFADSADKTTCLDVPEISKSFSERLTINNTTEDLVTSDLVLLIDNTMSDFGFSLNDIAGVIVPVEDQDKITVTFSNVQADLGLNIYDLVVTYNSNDLFNLDTTFVIDYNGERYLSGDDEIATLNYNFINCQSKVQVLAESESKDVCSFEGGYNLNTSIVIYNPTLEALSFNTIELTYSEDEVGDATFNLNEVDASTNNFVTNTLEFNYDDDLVVQSNQSLILPLSITFDAAFSYTINKITFAGQDIALNATYAVSNNDENQCPEAGVVELLVSDDVEAKVCTDIEGLPNTYTHRVEILNGHDENVDVILTQVYDPVLEDDNGNPIPGIFDDLVLVPGMNIYEIEIDLSNNSRDLNLTLSLAADVDQNLVSLGNFGDSIGFDVDFDNNCFQSLMTLDTVEVSRDANMCFLEGGEFEFNFVFNSNTQDQKTVNTLSIGLNDFDQDGGDSLEVYIDNVPQDGVYDSNTGDYTFNAPISFEANDAYVITVKFTDAAVEGDSVSIDALILNFADGTSLPIQDGVENTINLTNDLSDCEGLVITGVSSLQDYCEINALDQEIRFFYTVYNPTDVDIEVFADTDNNNIVDDFVLANISSFHQGYTIDEQYSALHTAIYSSDLLGNHRFIVPANGVYDFVIVAGKDEGLINELFDDQTTELDFVLNLDPSDRFSAASDLRSNVKISKFEDCGNVIAPENILVASSNVGNFEYAEASQLPYCVYGTEVLRFIPVTVLNRFSQPVRLADVDFELINSQGSDLNYNLGSDFDLVQVNNAPDSFVPNSPIVIEPLESYSFVLKLESSLLYSGAIILTVNVTDLEGIPLGMPDNYTQHEAAILLDVNAADGGVECDESDLFSFVQEKDDLIINSEGRPKYLSAFDPIGKLYINNTHIALNDISNYGAIENDWVNQGFGFKDFTLFDFVILQSDNYLNFDLFSFEVNESFIVGTRTGTEVNDNLIDQFNVEKDFNLDVYRFGSAWNYRVIDNDDRRLEYTIDFNMPEVMDNVRFNLFNTLGNSRQNYAIQGNLQSVLESYKIELMKDDGSIFDLADSNDGLLFAGLNITQSDLAIDFSSYSSLIITLDYVDNVVEVFTPDVIFYHDENDNNVLDLDALSPFVMDSLNVNNYIGDHSSIDWVPENTPINNMEFFIGSPVTEGIEFNQVV